MTMLTIDSPLGPLRLVERHAELAGLYLPAQAAPDASPGTSPLLARVATQLAEYFAGERRVFELPIAPRGTGFQERVWHALTTISYGETWSYGALAHAIGRPSASRAVGTANGRNPISIIVPCHRVIAASGELTGYAGGLPAKQWLLAHEARVARDALARAS
ncbi:MAG: methylated-DNA--[protein]-cysteine S-methyltransferase [Kofleriaceae bacterium]